MCIGDVWTSGLERSARSMRDYAPLPKETHAAGSERSLLTLYHYQPQ